MMPVMPVITPAVSAVPSAAPSAEKSGPGFEETLRSERASLSRTADHAAGQEDHVQREEREASVRMAGREKSEGEPAEKPVRTGQMESATGEAGESEPVAVDATRKSGNISGVQEDLSNQAQMIQPQQLPAWLLVPQVVTMPVVAAGEVVASAASPGTKSVRSVADAQVSIVQAGFAKVSGLPGALPASGNTEVTAEAMTESVALSVPMQPVGVEEQVSKRIVGKEKGEMPVDAGIIRGANDPEISAPPVIALRGSRVPLAPEISNRAAGISPVSLNQTASQTPLQQMASPVSLEQTASPVSLNQTASPVSLNQTASQASLQQTASPVLVDQMASPVLVDQMASPGLVNQTANPVLMNHMANPVLVSQAASPSVPLSTLRAEIPVMAPGENSLQLDVTRAVDPGLRATVIATLTSGESASEHRQFADFSRTASDEIEKVVGPVDPGRTEFSALISGSDNSVTGGVVRASSQAQATPAATPMLAMDGRIVDQVVSRVKMSSASGETSLSMTLHPKELGEIRVDLVSGKDGLRAHLHSQTQMVQEALERHLPRLREAFEAQGVKLSDLQVSCDDRRDGRNAAFQQNEQGQSSHLRYRTADSLAGAASKAEWPGGLGATGSGWSSAPGFSLRV